MMATRALRSIMPNGHQRKPSSKQISTRDLHEPGHEPTSDTRSKESQQTLKSPTKSRNETTKVDGKETLSFATRSKRSASFKSLLERQKAEPSSKDRANEEGKGLKKSKSSTSLSAFLSRPKSSKGLKQDSEWDRKDKENQTPPNTADPERPPPIWAQFATQDPSDTFKVPLNDVSSGGSENTTRCQQDKERPRSGVSEYRDTRSHGQRSPVKTETSGLYSNTHRPKPADLKSASSANQACPTDVIRGSKESRVAAAVAAFNDKSKPLPAGPSKRISADKIDPKAVSKAFEEMLDRRNVPHVTRDKMRSLDISLKANLIRQDTSGAREGSSSCADAPIQTTSTSESESSRSKESGGTASVGSETPKRPRPRSLNFSFSKGDLSPSKKQKSDSHQRNKSQAADRPLSTKPSIEANLGFALASPFKREKNVSPEHLIEFLRHNTNPLIVELSKLQKLRQLLRNETVTWVESFVSQQGLSELLRLLYRTIEVEWREEHEDNVLHELLLCLKALSTTSSAMDELSQVQSTLFPKLLAMLFDEEKKGPSEYNTRGVITSLLFSYLALSKQSSHEIRAKTILSYLRDPAPPEKAQLPGFITSIYHPRPFRVWHKELNNLTKEVFWIFLHHANIIPFALDGACASVSSSSETNPTSFFDRHFPGEHTPQPAAPYIGGVEWEATMYATTHLDLINGVLASLPTAEERNKLREEMRVSGFERIMGGYLRTCKSKFYGAVHEALSVWIGAAREDGWPFKDVREGLPREGPPKSPRKVAVKKEGGKAPESDVRRAVNGVPKLDVPRLDLGNLLESRTGRISDGQENAAEGGWF